MTATLSPTPSTPAPSTSVTVGGAGFNNVKTRLLFEGVVAGATICSVPTGLFSSSVVVGAATGSKTISAEQYIAGVWTQVATTTVTVTAPAGPPAGTIVPAGTSLAAAIAAASPGATLILRGATYSVSSVITTSKSFNLVNYPGEIPVVTHLTARPDFIYLQGGPNTFTGIRFKAGGGTFDDSMGSALVEAESGCHDLTVDGCTFIGHSAMSSRQQLFYIAVSTGPIEVLNSTFIGNGSSGSGFHMYHDPGPTGVHLHNSTFSGFAYEAAVLVQQLATSVLIEDNTISNNNIAIQYVKSNSTTIRNNTGTGNTNGLQIISGTNLTQSGNTL